MVGVVFTGIRLDAQDVMRVSTFWANLLGWKQRDRADGAVIVVPDTSSSYAMAVYPASAMKRSQNRIHLDLTTGSSEEMERLVLRAHELGGTDVDIGQSQSEPHTVLADPEGNEFCVIEPENTFLANAGPVGAINCDGTREVGHFWSAALGWPLVWDHDQESAVQSPEGGSKITWSGPPLMARDGHDRLRFELEAHGPMPAEIARLVSLGARVSDAPTSFGATLLDPDGNQFHLGAMLGVDES